MLNARRTSVMAVMRRGYNIPRLVAGKLARTFLHSVVPK
jgi:hypothetical protein